MSKVIIYHNPRCSHSRQSLALLEQQGYKPEVIEYLKTTPSVTELKKIIKILQIEPRELLRTKEKEYTLLHLDDPKLTDAELIKVMHDNPILIQRPIVIIGNRACIGRPPEKILEII